eukprot:TRINITY_DN8862_c0_g1_i2.p1 TRINITY_DN8862_c0_g1~~TRINITY_DN8862_c0_g1_i2.p1  ORF type:complete len:624 (+),score=154.21 TRINITY_DN8862_c0_g1_i2:95-1966(+)
MKHARANQMGSLFAGLALMFGEAAAVTHLRRAVPETPTASLLGVSAHEASFSGSGLKAQETFLTNLMHEAQQDSAAQSMALTEVAASLVKIMGQTDEPTDPALQHFVANMGSSVNALQSNIPDLRIYEQRFQSRIDAFKVCDHQLDIDLAKIALYRNQSASKRALHMTCRQAESSKAEAVAACKKSSGEISGFVTENQRCADWAGMKALTPESQSKVCQKQSATETYEDYLERVKIMFTNELLIFRALKEECGGVMSTAPPTCDSEKREASTQVETCDAAQASFETAACGVAHMERDAWNTARQCYNDNRALFEQDRADAQAALNTVKSEYASTSQIECLLEGMKTAKTKQDSDAAILKCKNLQPPPAAKLTLQIPFIPAPRQLTFHVGDIPGTQWFSQQEYKKMPEFAPARPARKCPLKQLVRTSLDGSMSDIKIAVLLGVAPSTPAGPPGQPGATTMTTTAEGILEDLWDVVGWSKATTTAPTATTVAPTTPVPAPTTKKPAQPVPTTQKTTAAPSVLDSVEKAIRSQEPTRPPAQPVPATQKTTAAPTTAAPAPTTKKPESEEGIVDSVEKAIFGDDKKKQKPTQAPAQPAPTTQKTTAAPTAAAPADSCACSYHKEARV